MEAPTPNDACLMLICNDHEEVGSGSNTGAAGPFLTSIMRRIIGSEQDLFYQSMAQSTLVSVDNAHALHPNYKDKHDGNHAPILNKGVVLKINANQRYASSNRGIAQLKMLAQAEGIVLQPFVMRADMACGSTIGPITAALTGVETVDLGVPTFAMHSIREFAGTKDVFELHRLLRAYYADIEI
jgi:aspartyl aminopeptidase